MAEVKDKLVTVESLASIYNSLNSKITQRDLLWENASPTSSFAEQTLGKLTTTNNYYDAIEIVYYAHTKSKDELPMMHTTGMIPTDIVDNFGYFYIDIQAYEPRQGVTNFTWYRKVSISSNYYYYTSFSDAIKYSEESDNTQHMKNDALIPIRIYGYKLGG